MGPAFHRWRHNGGLWVPLIFGLLPGFATEDYSVFFTLIKETVAENVKSTGFKFKKVLCDYELSIHNALKECFGEETEIRGCNFHYSQCIFRKVQSLGMQREYLTARSKVRIFSKMDISLSHVPPSRLTDQQLPATDRQLPARSLELGVYILDVFSLLN